MPPSKTRTVRSKVSAAASSTSKSAKAKSASLPPKQQKSKRPLQSSSSAVKSKNKKKKSYTAEELGVPKLNGIIPAGVIKPKGKKKGKVFVDDQERMMTILAMVNADAEGKVESKMMRERQLEEIREARRVEAEKREDKRKGVLENAKDQIRLKRKQKTKGKDEPEEEQNTASKSTRKSHKKVSFAS